MTKEELYEEIETRKIAMLEETKMIPDEELDFIIKFTKEYDLRDPWSCLKIDLDELFYYAMLVETYFDKTPLVKKVHEENKDFFTTRDIDSLKGFFRDLDLIHMLLEADQFLKIVDLKDPESIRQRIKSVSSISNSKYCDDDQVNTVANIIILKCMKSKEFERAVTLVTKLRNFKIVIQEAKKYISENIDAKSSFEKQSIQTSVLKENINDLYKINDLGTKVNEFYKTLEKVLKDHDDKVESQRQLNQKVLVYEKFKSVFERLLTQDEIVDYKDLIHYLDEDLKVAVLTIINNHNQNGYKKIEASSNLENIRYGLLLKEFGISQSDYTHEEISKLSLETTKDMLIKLTDLGIKEPSILLQIIKSSSKESIDKLFKYIKKGIIKKSFIENNPTVFDISSDIYKNVLTNIATSINNNISLTYISKNQDALLIPSQNFYDNVAVLTEYGIKSKLTPEVSWEVLSEIALAEKLDTIIELGYENALKANLNLAAYPKTSWEKIQLLRQMGIEVEEEQLDMVLQSQHFIVGEEDIKNYITKALPAEVDDQLNTTLTPDISVANPLELHAISELAYNIGNIIVSRPKVIRNLKKLASSPISPEEKLLLSVVKNMSLTFDEYAKVKQMVGTRKHC